MSRHRKASDILLDYLIFGGALLLCFVPMIFFG